jgi:hypothetical protein
VIEPGNRAWVRDIDLVVAVNSGQMDAACKAHLRMFFPDEIDGLQCDLSVVDASRVRLEQLDTMLKLALAFRSMRLVGQSLWDSPPSLASSPELADRLLRGYRRQTDEFLRRVSHGPSAYDPAPLVEWIQKRALRAGGLRAMMDSGVMTRHPIRCAEVIADSDSTLASLAFTVAEDFTQRRHDANAWARAKQLYCCATAITVTVY